MSRTAMYSKQFGWTVTSAIVFASSVAATGKPDVASQSTDSSQAAASKPAAGAEAPVASATDGILPVPEYSGDLWSRHFASGDWGGARTDLANDGFQVKLDWIQFGQGVSDGGRDETTRYSGKLDLVALLDLQRMGVAPGALVKVRVESRYGASVNGAAGPILPVNTSAFFPLTDELDDDIPIAITNLLYTQFLSTQCGVFLGKLDTLDGDMNEFASGRGATQFMNANFVFNSSAALRLPYATLGGGIVWMPSGNVTVTSSVINTVDSSTTSGFDDFGDGTTWTTEANFKYALSELPGGQNLGVIYSFDQDFAKIDGQLVFQPGQGFAATTEDDTWAVYWSAWQYCSVEDPSDAPVDISNGEADRQGVGFFARFGFADKDTNPVEWSASGGIGGRGVFNSRDDDAYGLGYFYTSLQTGQLSGITGVQDQVQGFEAFYKFALTGSADLTLDAQVVEAPTSAVDDALVLGIRLNIGI